MNILLARYKRRLRFIHQPVDFHIPETSAAGQPGREQAIMSETMIRLENVSKSYRRLHRAPRQGDPAEMLHRRELRPHPGPGQEGESRPEPDPCQAGRGDGQHF